MSERSGQPSQSSGTGAARLALYTVPVLAAAIASFIYFARTPETQAESGSVQVAGSETMRPIVTACAEEFMTRNPQADVMVAGGGSGDGIAALLHGVVDIAMTSRDLSAGERDYASANGIDISVFGLALDGITVIVNPANTLVALDLGQLRGIFAGASGYWSEFGAGASEIVVFARAAGSGTAALFGDRVMESGPYIPSAHLLPTNEAIVAEVAARPGAIGYTDLGALHRAGDRIKVIALRSNTQSEPVSPTPETIRAGSYPLARMLHLATAGEPAGTVKAFVDFCSSPAGAALLEKAGYVGVGPAT